MLSSDLDLLSHSHVEFGQFIGPVSTNTDAPFSIAKSVLIAVQLLFYVILRPATPLPLSYFIAFPPPSFLSVFFKPLTFVNYIYMFVLCFIPVPPQPPVIVGLERDEVKAGRILVLECVSHGGNPLANLQWTNVKHLVSHCHVGKLSHLR